ncbi:MAG TPA: sensor domain-containing protein [Rhizomicrobium sp.]|jgi:uncharacterized membrane protein|nr:sensor domain-containing protein [Rhizomicrobium sp.]
MNSTTPQPETVKAYLDALRAALKGAPAGLISDALSDAEEHLNNEMAAQPELSEKQILASVIDTYGTPEEIAEEYRHMETTISGPFPKSEEPQQQRYGFFNVVSDPRTYGALMYMLLSLATGIFYFTWVVTGLALSLSFMILIIGIPFAMLFVASVRVLAHVEGRLVEGLLGVRMPRRLPPATSTDESIWTKVKEAITDARTWSSMFYLALMLPLGIVYFTLAITGVVCSLGVAAVSLWVLVTDNADHIQVSGSPFLEHLFHTAPGLLLLAVVGMLLFFVVLHLARGVGWFHGKVAELLLVRL